MHPNWANQLPPSAPGSNNTYGYQGDYIGHPGGAPASDLPPTGTPAYGSSSKDSQLSAPACLPPTHATRGHQVNRQFGQMQQQQQPHQAHNQQQAIHHQGPRRHLTKRSGLFTFLFLYLNPISRRVLSFFSKSYRWKLNALPCATERQGYHACGE